MLTFEYGPDGVLEITVDRIGIHELGHVLSKLEVGDHEHMFTVSWGGYGNTLTEEFPNTDLAPIHKVTISRVDDDPASSG